MSSKTYGSDGVSDAYHSTSGVSGDHQRGRIPGGDYHLRISTSFLNDDVSDAYQHHQQEIRYVQKPCLVYMIIQKKLKKIIQKILSIYTVMNIGILLAYVLLLFILLMIIKFPNLAKFTNKKIYLMGATHPLDL